MSTVKQCIRYCVIIASLISWWFLVYHMLQPYIITCTGFHACSKAWKHQLHSCSRFLPEHTTSKTCLPEHTSPPRTHFLKDMPPQTHTLQAILPEHTLSQPTLPAHTFLRPPLHFRTHPLTMTCSMTSFWYYDSMLEPYLNLVSWYGIE